MKLEYSERMSTIRAQTSADAIQVIHELGDYLDSERRPRVPGIDLSPTSVVSALCVGRSCAESEVMHAVSYAINEGLLARL
jgi:hypothetical protein